MTRSVTSLHCWDLTQQVQVITSKMKNYIVFVKIKKKKIFQQTDQSVNNKLFILIEKDKWMHAQG